MDDKKICPLLAMGDPDHTPVSAQCRGGRCAWAYEGGCAIVSVAKSLDGLDYDGFTVYEG